MKDQELQTSVEVTDTATLTDVSNTTGTQPAVSQTTQYGSSHSECADVETNAIYDLSYFAEEHHSMWPAHYFVDYFTLVQRFAQLQDNYYNMVHQHLKHH